MSRSRVPLYGASTFGSTGVRNAPAGTSESAPTRNARTVSDPSVTKANALPARAPTLRVNPPSVCGCSTRATTANALASDASTSATDATLPNRYRSPSPSDDGTRATEKMLSFPSSSSTSSTAPLWFAPNVPFPCSLSDSTSASASLACGSHARSAPPQMPPQHVCVVGTGGSTGRCSSTLTSTTPLSPKPVAAIANCEQPPASTIADPTTASRVQFGGTSELYTTTPPKNGRRRALAFESHHVVTTTSG
mmetsp:Transcript_8406/g.27924  ORF Transcript_8406/g.27924 Transcript_8406/m.27924 type:complete len:250 (-) Transcript_8406:164-913(-)